MSNIILTGILTSKRWTFDKNLNRKEGNHEMLQMAKRLWKEEYGQGMAEYGLILALVSVVVIAVLAAMGGSIADKFEVIKSQIEGAQPQQPSGGSS